MYLEPDTKVWILLYTVEGLFVFEAKDVDHIHLFKDLSMGRKVNCRLGSRTERE